MNTNVRTNSVSLSGAMNDYINKRLKKLSKLLDGDSSVQCDLELSKTTEHHQKGEIFRAEIHIVGSNKNIYAAAEKDDLYSAVDKAQEEVLRELRAGKSKRISLIRRSGARVKNMMKGLWPWGKRSALF